MTAWAVSVTDPLLEWRVKPILSIAYINALVTYSQPLLEQLLGDSPEAMGVEVTTVDSLVDKYYVKAYSKTAFTSYEQCLDCLANAIALQAAAKANGQSLHYAIATTEFPAKNIFIGTSRRALLAINGKKLILGEINDSF